MIMVINDKIIIEFSNDCQNKNNEWKIVLQI